MFDPLRERLHHVDVPPEGRARAVARIVETWEREATAQPASVSAAEQPVVRVATTNTLTRDHLPGDKLPGTPRSWRRRFLVSSSAMALCGLAVLFSVWVMSPDRLDVYEVDRAVVDAILGDRSSPNLPSGPEVTAANLTVPYRWEWPKSFEASLLHDARLQPVEVHGRSVVTLSFILRRMKGQAVRGQFVVIPRSWLKSTPVAEEFLRGAFTYNQRYATTWWVEGSYAYACCLPASDMNLFQRCVPYRWAT